MADTYDDIINLPHWDPKNHERMPMANRAAQFAPFAALTGHDDAIRETARLTDKLQDIDEESAKLLNEKINLLIESIESQPEIEVTFFRNDDKKEGGSYSIYKGSLRRIDEVEQLLVFTDSTVIPILSISNITGDIFAEIDNRE